MLGQFGILSETNVHGKSIYYVFIVHLKGVQTYKLFRKTIEPIQRKKKQQASKHERTYLFLAHVAICSSFAKHISGRLRLTFERHEFTTHQGQCIQHI